MRQSKFGNVLGAIAIVVLILLLIFMPSCKTQCVPEMIEVHDTIRHTDSIYVERVRDSVVYKDRQDSTYIYERDSVSEKERNDTIFITRYKTLYKYILQAHSEQTATSNQVTDSEQSTHSANHVSDEVVVKTERYVPGFYKFTLFWFLVTLVLIAMGILWWLADYIPQLAWIKKIAKLFNIFK